MAALQGVWYFEGENFNHFQPQAGHRGIDDTYMQIIQIGLALEAATDSGDTGGPDGKRILTELQAKWRKLASELA